MSRCAHDRAACCLRARPSTLRRASTDAATCRGGRRWGGAADEGTVGACRRLACRAHPRWRSVRHLPRGPPRRRRAGHAVPAVGRASRRAGRAGADRRAASRSPRTGGGPVLQARARRRRTVSDRRCGGRRAGVAAPRPTSGSRTDAIGRRRAGRCAGGRPRPRGDPRRPGAPPRAVGARPRPPDPRHRPGGARSPRRRARVRRCRRAGPAAVRAGRQLAAARDHQRLERRGQLYRRADPRDRRSRCGDLDAPGVRAARDRRTGRTRRAHLRRRGGGHVREVFLAEDPALRRGVAIKRIRPALRSDRTFRARLRREAQLAGLLSHRAIVQVFDLITDDSVDHLIMEYVPGPSLHTLLAGSPMPVAQAVRIAAEIADGLACAHRHGIVHRDLKLENILIGTDGQPKIADFGIARRTASAGDRGHESLTRDGLVVGTSRAMSPEQIQNHDIDARSDLFSFGVMLYELVTGVSPFAAPAEALTMLRILTERHTPAHALCSGVPRALSDLIDDLLEKIPARRPDSARTVRDRLRRMPDLSSAPRAPHDTAHEPGPADAIVGTRPLDAPVPDVPARTRIGRGSQGPALGAAPLGDGSDPLARRCLSSRIQAPFVLAEIRALRSSIFKRSPEIQSALAIASKVELSYDLRRADLFIPAGDTWCAILEPFAATVLTGTLRRIGYEIFPQYVALLGIAEPDVKAEMDLKTPTDLVRVICDAYSKCVVGSDAGTLTPRFAGGTATVEDTTFIPCQLQMGVFLGAGKLTGLFGDIALTETSCRARGGSACTYEFMFGPSWLAAPKRPGDI
ncbi:MAG: serine/threonine protein kinase [Deltaproteobacteria bacterium]|nr:MAG: serine/threonine protein kinase [Deltaproteobacteria bacterium]